MVRVNTRTIIISTIRNGDWIVAEGERVSRRAYRTDHRFAGIGDAVGGAE